MAIDLSAYAGKKCVVTGGNGFFGRHLYAILREAGARAEAAGPDLDLRDGDDALLAVTGADFVFHLAGHNGGIAYNLERPAEIFRDNTLMALQVLEACRVSRVKKFIGVVASCAYPDPDGYPWDLSGVEDGILAEEHFLGKQGPHPTVACHGYAKRNLHLACQFHAKQYGLNAVCVCPTTLYGPGDSYDSARTKVVGGMVRRFCDAVDAGETSVTCWGTGSALRELLHVRDAARLTALAGLRFDDPKVPLNLASGKEVSVHELAELTAQAAGWQGEIRWDNSRPDGQHRKRLDSWRIRTVLGRQDFVPLPEGLAEACADYRARKAAGEVFA